MKRAAQKIAPPLLYDAARRIRDRVRAERSESEPKVWEYVPGGELRIGEEGSGRGWNVKRVAEIYRERWIPYGKILQGPGPLATSYEDPALAPNSADTQNTILAYAYVLALSARMNKSVSILDWGGGIGHYYLLSRAILPDVSLDYHCKDVPLVAEVGRQLLPEGTFYDDESCLQRRYDLVCVSGSLQYSKDWRATLQRLGSATARYLYVTRLPVVETVPSFSVVQRAHSYGYDTEYVGWFINRSELMTASRENGLALRREFLVMEAPIVHGAPEQCAYRGFLFEPVAATLG